MTVDLTLLRPGVKVRLRGDTKPQPRKPYPRGWREVAEVDSTSVRRAGANSPITTTHHAFRVVSDERWLPVELIEEIRP
jgi:hypothetical protein